MNKQALLSGVFFVFILIGSVQAQWSGYDCSVLPAEADTLWREYIATNNDGVSEILSVVDDPDILGNKLIKVDGSRLNFKEMWRLNWNANSDIGTTILFRAKALDTTVYDYDFDLYFKDGNTQERLVSKKGKSLSFLKSGTSVNFNTTEWHIYRVTIGFGSIDVYIDEAPISYLSGTGKSISVNFFLFGDGLESSTVGSLYDWLIWDVSGAYPPNEGTALPDTLTGLTTAVQKSDYIKPVDFCLYQNFPNPFNPSTEIHFSLPTPGHVSLKIYDTTGRLIHTLINEFMPAGSHNVVWNGRNAKGNSLPSGVYLYSIQSDHFNNAKKMTLIK